MARVEWLRRRAHGVLYRGVRAAAPRAGLHAYAPSHEHDANLDELTAYAEDARPIRDKRETTASAAAPDLTITVQGLADVLAGRELHGLRVLEVGPKYGIHTRWIDAELEPTELVLNDFEADAFRHEQWVHELRAPHRFVYGDLRNAGELLELEPFDLVFFLGVLYHSVHHLELLGMINRCTRLGGTMLLETTVDPRPDASVRLRWHGGNAKAKAVPTVAAVRVLLAWTGWRTVTRFTDYRPGSSEALFLCEKTDELAAGAAMSELVRPQRGEPEREP
jgi:SAM-dependent methyltransferase